MMNLDDAKKIRSIIDYYPEYKIIDDIHVENDEVLMKVSIAINSKSVFVPSVSEWYIVFNSSDDICFYPAKENSIVATFPHQANNIDLQERCYRSGKPCLDIPEHTLNLPDTYYPYSSDSRFEWYLGRMVAWLNDAANNNLLKVGDPFEVPITEFAKYNLIYKEEDVESWSDFHYRLGYATLKLWGNNNVGYYVLDRLYDKDEISRHAVNWGDISNRFVNFEENQIWVICNKFPIIEPWQYPKTWEELISACKYQDIDIFNIIQALLWKDRKYMQRFSHLLIGCPIPEKYGMENKVYYWLMCDMPQIVFPRNGFRINAEGFRSYLKSILKGQIAWHKTENWDDSAIRTRGMVQDKLRKLSVAIIGAGSLGGFVCELLSRQGITKIKVLDGDNLHVGNLSRHVLTLNQVESNKAKAIAERLSENSPSVKVEAIEEYINLNNIANLEDCDVIIDCTGNNAVVDLLAAYEFKKTKNIYVGAFNYGATGFAFYKQKSNQLNSKLFYEMISGFYNNVLDIVNEKGLVMEGIGCYHPVFPALDSDITLWAAVFVKEIIKDLEDPATGKIKAFEQSPNGAVEVCIDETF